MAPSQIINGRLIRIALVGCGRISSNHIKAIAFHSDKAEIVALCDTDQSRLDSAQKIVAETALENSSLVKDPKQFIGYENLLAAIKSDALEVDLVVLTTPSGLHAAQTIAASQVGVHVCTEKPMATRWSDALSMVEACDHAGVHLFVVKQNRFNSTLQLVKKQIDSGRFGQINLVTVNVFWQRPQEYYDQANWRGTWALDGGALMNQASHYVDLLTWLAGPVESLSASTATLGRNIEAEDTAVIQLKFRNSALGTMSVTMLTYPENIEGSITILGEYGSVKVGGKSVNKIDYWRFADSAPDDNLIKELSYSSESVYGYGHSPYYKNMFDVINGLSEPICNGREGLKSLEILIGSYRSSRNNKFVTFPLVDEET